MNNAAVCCYEWVKYAWLVGAYSYTRTRRPSGEDAPAGLLYGYFHVRNIFRRVMS
jgi:hypothetical protein